MANVDFMEFLKNSATSKRTGRKGVQEDQAVIEYAEAFNYTIKCYGKADTKTAYKTVTLVAEDGEEITKSCSAIQKFINRKTEEYLAEKRKV